MFRPISRNIHQAVAQPLANGSVVSAGPLYPALRVPVAPTFSEAPSGSASWDSPPEMAAGDRILVLVTAGPASPSIGTPSGWTELETFTTAGGVTASAFYFDSPTATPISESFSFPDDNSWVVVPYLFQAGSFDPAQAPASDGIVVTGPNPDTTPLVFGWGPFIGTFCIATISTISESGVVVTAYPLPDNNTDTASTGGEGGGSADVEAAGCSIRASGTAIDPGGFTHAGINETVTITIAIKGFS